MKQTKKSTTAKISKEQLVALVASKLPDQILFTKKFEDAKNYVSRLDGVKFG